MFFSGKDSLEIDRSVKMPLHRPSMGAVGSRSWVPATTTSSTHLDSLRIGVSLLLLVNLLSLTVLPGPIPYAFQRYNTIFPIFDVRHPAHAIKLDIGRGQWVFHFAQCDVKNGYTSRRSHSVNHLSSILDVVTLIEVNSHTGLDGCRLPVAGTFSSLGI